MKTARTGAPTVLAAMAARTGAKVLLVTPSRTLMLGGQLRPEMAVAHHRGIADATFIAEGKRI